MTKIKNKKYLEGLIKIEERIKEENKDKYYFGKLYNEEFKKKFQSLNKTSISDKKWHILLQKLCDYKKNKQLLDTVNGPIIGI